MLAKFSGLQYQKCQATLNGTERVQNELQDLQKPIKLERIYTAAYRTENDLTGRETALEMKEASKSSERYSPTDE